MPKPKLTKAQRRLLDDMKGGKRLFLADNGLSAWIGRRRVSRQTVGAMERQGLIVKASFRCSAAGIAALKEKPNA